MRPKAAPGHRPRAVGTRGADVAERRPRGRISWHDREVTVPGCRSLCREGGGGGAERAERVVSGGIERKRWRVRQGEGGVLGSDADGREIGRRGIDRLTTAA